MSSRTLGCPVELEDNWLEDARAADMGGRDRKRGKRVDSSSTVLILKEVCENATSWTKRLNDTAHPNTSLKTCLLKNVLTRLSLLYVKVVN